MLREGSFSKSNSQERTRNSQEDVSPIPFRHVLPTDSREYRIDESQEIEDDETPANRLPRAIRPNRDIEAAARSLEVS